MVAHPSEVDVQEGRISAFERTNERAARKRTAWPKLEPPSAGMTPRRCWQQRACFLWRACLPGLSCAMKSFIQKRADATTSGPKV
eukprot:8146391-Pyramimonas_sp.AAC.1